MRMICRMVKEADFITISDEKLGSGGEGAVYDVVSHKIKSLPPATEMVAKIYYTPETDNREQKILGMIKNVPNSEALAWPLALIYSENKKFAGYIMKKLDFNSYRMWAELAHSQQRRHASESFDFKYALTTARNLGIAIQSVHDAGHCLGDINESNIFIKNDANVFIVDTDSAQVKFDQKIFPCLVGKPEYTAPELVGKNFRETTRTFETDIFAYTVAVYQMLTGGAHPTDGIFQGKGEVPSVAHRIEKGIYPNLDMGGKSFKKIDRVPTECLPEEILKIFQQNLSNNPADRLPLDQSIIAIDNIIDNLTQCKKVSQHWYLTKDFKKCPWCEKVKKGGVDIWVETKPFQQKSLPGLSFNKEKKENKNISQNSRSQRIPLSQTQTTAPLGWSNNKTPFNPSSSPATKIQPNFVKRFDPEKVSEKIHGKTVVQFADGSLRERPPLLEVYKTQPKFARQMFFDEYPDVLKFWCPTNRPLPLWWSLILGLIITCGISYGWFFVIPYISSLVPDFMYKEIIFHYWTLASVVSTILFSTILILTSLKEILRMKKMYGNIKRVETEKWWRTTLRFIPVSVFYGAIVVAFLVFILIFLILKSIYSAIKEENEQKIYRY